MKRYLGTLFLGICTAISIGGYYLFGASGGMPEFKLVKLEGNALEEERMVLYGSYGGNLNHHGLNVSSKSLSITSQGTDYFLRSSFVERDAGASVSLLDRYDDLAELKRQYRGFMRAKSNVLAFYKDEQWLIYADIELRQASGKEQNYVLLLEALELATGETRQLEQRLAGQTEYAWMNVRDVQLLDEKLHVLTNSYESGIVIFQEYIFDFSEGTLISQRRLEHAEGLQTNVRSATPSAPSEWVLFTPTTKETAGLAVLGEEEKSIMRKQGILYSYRTGQFVALPKIDLLTYDSVYQDNTDYSLDEQWVFFASVDDGEINVIRYELESGKPMPGELRLSAEALGGKFIGAMVVEQQRIYALIYDDELNPENKMFIVAIDAVTGEILYRGQLVPTGSGQADMQRLRIDRLTPY